MNKFMVTIMVMLLSVVNYAHDFLGFTLGQSQEEARAIISSGPHTATCSGKKSDAGNSFTLIYHGNNKLKDAEETRLLFFDNQLAMISVSIYDTAENCKTIYDALIIRLSEKYTNHFLDDDDIRIQCEKFIVGQLEEDPMIVRVEKSSIPSLATNVNLTAEDSGLIYKKEKADVDLKAKEFNGF